MKPGDPAGTGNRAPVFSPVLCRIAAQGLDVLGPRPRQIATGAEVPLDEAAWSSLLAGASRQRMLGLLVAAIAEESLPATPGQLDEARRQCLSALAGDLLREQELIGVDRLLASHGIERRVLKGTAVAHLDYPDPALRSFADVDLLVRSDSWEAAMAVLEAAGWVRQFLEPRPGFERRFVKAMMLHRPDGPSELDLHRTFVLGPFGLTVRLEDLWSGAETFVLGDEHELKALDRESRFLQACFHAALGDLPPRLVPVRDVAQMALDERLDLSRVLALAAAWEAEAVVVRAVTLACGLLALEPAGTPLEALAALLPGRRQRRALEGYLAPGRSYVRLTVAATRAISAPADKVRYLAALAVPKREFLAPRYVSRSARYGAAMRALVAGRGRSRPGAGKGPR